MIKFNSFSYYIFSLIPIMLVAGPFLTDLSFFLLSTIFFIILVKEKKILYLNNIFFWYFLIFSFYIIFNSIINFENVPKNNFFFYLRFIIYSFAISYFLNQSKYIKTFLFYSFLLTILFFLDVIVFKILNSGILGVSMYSKYRISSFFYDELVMGSFFLKFLIIVNPLFLMLNRGKNILYLIIFNFISIFLIVVSGERSSLFLCIIYILLNFFILNFNIRKKIIFLLSIFLILIISFIYSDWLQHRFIIQPFISENFLENHISLFKASFMMFDSSPILGNGYRSFQILCQNEQYFINGLSYCSTHPHNYYLQLLAEIGLIGFIFVTIILLFFVYQYLKNFYYYLFNKNLIKPNYFNFCITGIIINLFPLTTTGNFFNNWLSCLFFFPIGIYIFLIKNKS